MYEYNSRNIVQHYYDQKMSMCLRIMGAVIDDTFSFDTYNDQICEVINSSEYILIKELLRKAIIVSNPLTPLL